MNAPASQHARAARSAQRIARSKYPGVDSLREAGILQESGRFVLQQTVGDFNDRKGGTFGCRMGDKSEMQIEEFIQIAEIRGRQPTDRKSTRLNSSHSQISYAVFCLKKKNTIEQTCNH